MIVLYANRSPADIAYKDIFDTAQTELQVKVRYFVTEPREGDASNTQFRIGAITIEQIQQEVPDYMERKFYISGPSAMVSSFKSMLKSLGVGSRNIKTDYFPGL